MGDLREFVKQVVRDVIKTEYPHARRPACTAAKVIRAKEKGKYYSYTLKPVDRNGQASLDMPEIPHVISDGVYDVGEKVALIYINGQSPYIIGRWHK